MLGVVNMVDFLIEPIFSWDGWKGIYLLHPSLKQLFFSVQNVYTLSSNEGTQLGQVWRETNLEDKIVVLKLVPHCLLC